MNVFVDSLLEALVFNYSTFHFLTLLNSLWTWFAAVSLGKIRGPKPEPELLHLPDCRDVDEFDPALEVLESDAVSELPCVSTLVVGNGGADVDGVTNGKFTVYYEDVTRECENDEVLDVTCKWEERQGRSNGYELSDWGESWERLLSLKIGENEKGWYTCQDLTVLNGNDVRLWDGEFR